jgi:hypothetical protein
MLKILLKLESTYFRTGQKNGLPLTPGGLAQWRATCTCHEPHNLLFCRTFQRATPAIAPNRLLQAVPCHSLFFHFSPIINLFLVLIVRIFLAKILDKILCFHRQVGYMCLKYNIGL